MKLAYGISEPQFIRCCPDKLPIIIYLNFCTDRKGLGPCGGAEWRQGLSFLTSKMSEKMGMKTPWNLYQVQGYYLWVAFYTNQGEFSI